MQFLWHSSPASFLRQVQIRKTARRACNGDPDALKSLTVMYAQFPDPAHTDALRMALTGDPDPAVVSAFCELVLRSGDSLLKSFAVAQGIEPPDPENRALFLFATGQVSRYRALAEIYGDSCLGTAYLNASEPVRKAVLSAAGRSDTETLFAKALVGSGSLDLPCGISGQEWGIIVSGLLAASRHGELYRLLPRVPVSHTVIAIRSLDRTGWNPGAVMGGLWADVVRLLPEKWSYPKRTDQQRAILEKPATQTRHLCFSPNGALLATGGYDGTLCVWDVKRGEKIFRIDGHFPLEGPPVFSPDSHLLAIRRIDGEIAVLHVPSGTPAFTRRGHGCGSCPASFSPDSCHIACAQENRIFILQAGDGSCVREIQSEGSGFSALSFSPDGLLLCGGYDDGAVQAWSLCDFSLRWTCHSSTGRIDDISFSGNGAWIIAFPANASAFCINARTGNRVHTFTNGRDVPHSGSYSWDRRYLCVNFRNDSVCVWNVDDGRIVAALSVPQKGGATCAAFSAEENIIITGGSRGIIRIYRPGATVPEQMFTAHPDHVSALAVTPDGKTLASAGWDGTTKLFSLPSGHILRPLPVNTLSPSAICLSGDSGTVAVADDDGRVWFWQVPEKRFVRTLDAFTGKIFSVALNYDASLLACAGTDGSVRLWNTEDGSLLGALTGISGGTRSLVFTRDGRRLCTGGWDGILRCWSVPECSLIMACPGHSGVITCVACSPDGTRFVCGGTDGRIRIITAESGAIVAECTADRHGVESVTVTPDGLFVAAGGREGIVRLFRPGDGSLVAEIAGAPAAIKSLSPVSGNDLLAAAAADGSIGYFSLTGRSHLWNFSAHAGSAIGAVYSGKGEVLISCGTDGTVRLWTLPESGYCVRKDPEIMDLIAYEVRNNPSQQARRQWEFLHALHALLFAHEICLFFPPRSIGEFDIGIVG
jgi:WD40 repeat protein